MGKNKVKNKRDTYTKEKMDLILNVALLDMQFPFILAFLGKEQIAETLGGIIVTQIIAVFAVYCLKSFFGKKEEEKLKYKKEQMLEDIELDSSESEEEYE